MPGAERLSPSSPAAATLRHGRRLLRRALGKSAGRHADLMALANLASLPGPYVPWSRVAMRPSGVTAVLNDIVLRSRTRIVECGGGITTLYIARLLRGREGRLWTIEHDAAWAEVLAGELAREGLAESVSIVVAPLVEGDSGAGESPWYAREVLEDAFGDSRFDLLIVDGPPAWDPDIRTARYPAVPFFAPRLAESWTIVLDDLRRAGEDEVAARWEREFGMSFERRLVRGGIAIAHSEHGPDD